MTNTDNFHSCYWLDCHEKYIHSTVKSYLNIFFFSSLLSFLIQARKYKFYIIADEAYQLVNFQPSGVVPLYYEDDANDPRILSVGTFSKMIGPGVKVCFSKNEALMIVVCLFVFILLLPFCSKKRQKKLKTSHTNIYFYF